MTPLRWPVRVWLAAEILFGLFGASAVLLAPAETATNFAWPIRTAAAAAVLGAFYASVAVMLVPALFARWWEEVRPVVAAAAVLTSVMLVATVLHWDLFAVGGVPFGLWFASYLLPPPTLLVLYIWQERTRRAPAPRQPLPGWLRACFLVHGAVFGAVWTFLFFLPSVLAGRGPWPMSPLIVRVYAGWFLGLGLLLWLLGRRDDWRETRLASLWLLALPPLLLVQLLRYPEQVTWNNLWLLTCLIDFTLLAVAVGALWVHHHGTPRRLATVAAVGMTLFLAALVAMPLLRPELDVRARWVGEYALGASGGLMTGAYLALGVGALTLALALRAFDHRLRRGATLLALASLGAFLSAVFQQDPTDTAARSLPGTVRELALIPTFALLVTALTLLTRALRGDPRWRPIRLPATLVLAGVIVVFALALLAPPEWKGLAGRVFDAAWTGWMLLVAVRLRILGHREPARVT